MCPGPPATGTSGCHWRNPLPRWMDNVEEGTAPRKNSRVGRAAETYSKARSEGQWGEARARSGTWGESGGRCNTPLRCFLQRPVRGHE